MSLNRVTLIGNVGKDPEIRYIDTGVCTARLSLATTTPGYTLPGGTQVPERTEWHTVLLWRRLAEVAERYVHKGDKLYIEGELRYRNYTDKKGYTHYLTEIWCNKLELLTPRAASTANPDAQPSASTAQPSTPTPQQPTQPTTPATNGGFEAPSHSDDALPF